MSTSISSSPIVNNSSTPDFNPHKLSDAELKELPESDKSVLVAMPTEPGTIWTETIGKSGRPYWTAKQEDVIIKGHSILSMLINAQSANFTHVVFGGFAFKYDNGKVIRTTYFEKQPGNPATGGKPAYIPKTAVAPKPRIVSEVFFGDPMEINQHISSNPEMKWEVFGDPKITDDGNKVIIVLVRYRADQ
jgi:hypothetical protein